MGGGRRGRGLPSLRLEDPLSFTRVRVRGQVMSGGDRDKRFVPWLG